MMNDWQEAERRAERAQELSDQGQWEDALKELTAALQLNPYNGQWQFNRGVALEAMGRADEAIEAYQSARQLQGDDPELLMILGRLHNLRGEYVKALALLTMAGKLDARDPLIHAELINTYLGLGDLETAETMFYMSIEHDELCTKAYEAMAGAQLQSGNYPRAIGCLERVLALDSEHPKARTLMARAYRRQGDLNQAYRFLLQHMRHHPGDVATMVEIGLLLVDMHRPVEADEKFRQAIELQPNLVAAHAERGRLALASNRLDTAQICFTRVLALDSRHIGANQAMADILLQRGATDRARRHIEQEMMLDGPRDVRSVRKLGRLLLDLHMPHRAASVFQQLTGQISDDPQLWDEYALALLMTGQLGPGVRACRRAVKLDPQMTGPMFNMAIAYLNNHQLSRALYWATRAAKLDRRDRRTLQLVARIRLLQVHQRLQRWRRALATRLGLG